MINPFEEIKNRLSVKEVAKRYGIKVLKNNMALCCFHQEKTSSLHFRSEKFFCCYGCGAKGSVIDFIIKLFKLTPLEAAKKLDKDFDLRIFNKNLTKKQKVKVKEKIEKEQECELIIEDFEGDMQEKENWFLMIFRNFRKIIAEFPPEKNEASYLIWHLAIHNIEHVENILDVLQRGNPGEKVESYEFVKDYQENLSSKILKILGSEEI